MVKVPTMYEQHLTNKRSILRNLESKKKKFAPVFESGAKVKASDEKRYSKISHATVPLRRRGMQTVHTNMYKIRGEECRLLEQTLSYILYHYQYFLEIFLTIY